MDFQKFCIFVTLQELTFLKLAFCELKFFQLLKKLVTNFRREVEPPKNRHPLKNAWKIEKSSVSKVSMGTAYHACHSHPKPERLMLLATHVLKRTLILFSFEWLRISIERWKWASFWSDRRRTTLKRVVDNKLATNGAVDEEKAGKLSNG